MSRIYDDRVMETTAVTGTGDATLLGAVTGFQRFADALSVADTFDYAIYAVDGAGVPTGEWETGYGTYSGADTLTRTSVRRSSDGYTAVSFSAGTKYVLLSLIGSSVRDLGIEALISETVISGHTTNVDVSSIPQGYRDLVIRILGRSSKAAQDYDYVYATINADTGSNYRWVRNGADMSGADTAHSATPAKDTRALIGVIPGATSAADGAGYIETVIPNYAGTLWNKLGWGKWTSVNSGAADMSGGNSEWQWNDNSAINEILIDLSSGDYFEDGTVIQLFGRG